MWVDIGEEKDFSKTSKTPKVIDGEEILVLFHKGKWHAIERKCPHQSRPLDEARLKDGRLKCIYHALEFDLDTGEITFDGGYIGLPPLRVYPVKVEKNHIWVNVR